METLGLLPNPVKLAVSRGCEESVRGAACSILLRLLLLLQDCAWIESTIKFKRRTLATAFPVGPTLPIAITRS